MRINVALISTIQLAAFLCAAPGSCFITPASADESDQRPNIIWLTAEDIGPQLGCYGDNVATTPNLDAFARRALVYEFAWSNYPVCAPARTTIISGRYACVDGAGNMRCSVPLPDGFQAFPVYLREAGYYCTNNSKTDYNYNNLGEVWDESSGKAHWKNRPDDAPFFSVFNYTGTHESKIRTRPHEAVIDPATVVLPPYWPDTPEVRQDWAQHYDNVTEMDRWFADHLQELDEAGLADNTVVFFFGDHGSGMPRHKRYAGNAGFHVPMIVHVPDKFRSIAPSGYESGTRSQRLVSFVDLAPTMLSLTGIEPEDFMQGSAFAGPHETDPPEYLLGFRERMDERTDLSHSIRNHRYLYIRNYYPEFPAGQHIAYQFETTTTAVWYRMFLDGELNEVQSAFWQPRPGEELYDLKVDPHETLNVAHVPALGNVARAMSSALETHARATGEQSLIPESIQFRRFGNNQAREPTPVEIAAIDQLRKHAGVSFVVESASGHSILQDPEYEHTNPAIRFWAAKLLLENGDQRFEGLEPMDAIYKLSADEEPSVQIIGLQSLVRYGDENQSGNAIEGLVQLANFNNSDYYSAIHALNVLESLKLQLTEEQLESIRGLPTKTEDIDRGMNYLERLVDRF